MASSPKTVALISEDTATGQLKLAEGLQVTLNAAKFGDTSALLEDKGESFPNADGEIVRLGDLYWRVTGTIEFGNIEQSIGLHILKENVAGAVEEGQTITLPSDTKFFQTAGNRWELFTGGMHPSEKYNINPKSYSPKYRSPRDRATKVMNTQITFG